ncbi:hypothetical protein BJX99DRAFT_237964 [Aspergillus californicus]
MPSDLRRTRKTYSCDPCRRSKLRCDRDTPCSSCKHRGCVGSCIYRGKAVNARSLISPASLRSADFNTHPGIIGNTIANGGNLNETTTSVNGPCQDFTNARWDAVFERPIQHIDASDSPAPSDCDNQFFPFHLGPRLSRQELLSRLPPWPCCDYLITQYFTVQAPLFHVLHSPTFEGQYFAFTDDPSSVDLSWLALLFSILSVTVHTIENDDAMLAKLWSDSCARDTAALSCQFRTAAMICLAQDNVLTNHHLSTLESLLILIYNISMHDGADRGWVLLGMALNIGIALQCNAASNRKDLNCIELERRRRCWAGILLLHTYQAIMFRDIDMAWLDNIPAVMPADVNDRDIHEHEIVRPSSQPTQMSVMMFKLQLFRLSNRVCSHLSKPTTLDETALAVLDAEIAQEQGKWDKLFLSSGRPNLLDAFSYGYWSILQLYAHHLYLLIHRPFCRMNSNTQFRFRPESRAKCIGSGFALLNLHREFCENPRLRHYRWNVYGMTSSYALHGAVALASCLLERTDGDLDSDSAPYRAAFDAALLRIQGLQDRSPICKKAYPILRHFQTMLSPDNFQWSNPAGYEFGNTFDNWIDSVQWLNPDSINWNYWDGMLSADVLMNQV